MKTIAIGDIHGRNVWEKIVQENPDFDRIVFIADYFDSFNVRNHVQIFNFKNILEFKRKHPEKCILLFGNHEFHYLKGISVRYDGFQLNYFEIQDLIHQALRDGLLQMCFEENGFLFSHAGITKTWCRNNNINSIGLVDEINDLFKYQPRAFAFTPGPKWNKKGDEVCQSPIWVRPNSLVEDKLNLYKQVVGHTIQEHIRVENDCIFIDTLGTSGEYLEINDSVITVKKVGPHKNRL